MFGVEVTEWSTNKQHSLSLCADVPVSQAGPQSRVHGGGAGGSGRISPAVERDPESKGKIKRWGRRCRRGNLPPCFSFLTAFCHDTHCSPFR
jgi:hypothetical protein